MCTLGVELKQTTISPMKEGCRKEKQVLESIHVSPLSIKIGHSIFLFKKGDVVDNLRPKHETYLIDGVGLLVLS